MSVHPSTRPSVRLCMSNDRQDSRLETHLFRPVRSIPSHFFPPPPLESQITSSRFVIPKRNRLEMPQFHFDICGQFVYVELSRRPTTMLMIMMIIPMIMMKIMIVQMIIARVCARAIGTFYSPYLNNICAYICIYCEWIVVCKYPRKNSVYLCSTRIKYLYSSSVD